VTADAAWAGVALGSRQALEHLGWNILPRCLPGEPEACGGSFCQHAAAHLATLQAVVERHMSHLGPEYKAMTAEVYVHAVEEASHW
jgi:hypothetical protein